MSSKKTTVYVNARQAELNALNIQISLRLTLSNWDLVHTALMGKGGVANPMRDMIGKLLTTLRATRSTVAFPARRDLEGPSASAEFDTDDLNALQVLMKFTFTLAEWKELLDQFIAMHRAGPVDQLYQALNLAVGKLSRDFTAQLVGMPDGDNQNPT